ncbi:RES family NAD+ phosphorylase [Parerythrobacter lacustris]|uniref:RES family NAD+ phosphorylase n=1 Tax=Parerythrobacter lacustris TaxID=2969984 RepID=A0ABT1XQ04_9SPHN|nr:RES family NAD+ phosphorylase [Parerythrobacter lacustris]MCR2833317.1 RES family NAD+ phosphorylase [Parerythrobacter lacustris]
MKLWRLTRAPYLALDGSGPEKHGARWVSPGRPVVNFASEPGLAVLVVLRYLPHDLAGIDEDYRLGWTEIDATPERLPFVADPADKRRIGDDWLASGRTLLAAVQSAVLPEADVVMMNPRHPDAASVPALQTRPFDFRECLKLPDWQD